MVLLVELTTFQLQFVAAEWPFRRSRAREMRRRGIGLQNQAC
jgi:hypothetical protein